MKKLTLQERVYTQLKQLIINGVLTPGEKLREVKLAEMLEASRTPLREAIRKLQQEGLVTYSPAQGAQVALLNRLNIVHLYECRSVLEGLSAKLASQHRSDRDMTIIEESVILAREYFIKGELDKVVEKNTIFHQTILHASANDTLIQMMNQIGAHIERYRKLTSDLGFRDTFLEEHDKIANAIRQQDEGKAESLMREHIDRDLSTFIKGLEDKKII